ncbi:MAG TPA: 4'-phosphopantetheinyl transferase superfamily protein [Polyangia bacterium]|nr:4'-phosphopantetheinyl transferase superfamily protein [Polyangia bacterium]
MTGGDFEVAFVRAHAWGFYAAVNLPRVRGRHAGEMTGVPDAILARLPAVERAHARTLAPARAVSWAGGRLALHAALAALAAGGGAAIDAGVAILGDARGAPVLPAGATGSISHKDSLAVAIAAVLDGARLVGIDLEELRPGRPDIASRVLTPAEQAALAGLDEAARRAEVLRRFAAKEAVYKALAPALQRIIGFPEVVTARAADGAWRASFEPRAGEPAFTVEVAELAAPALDHILLVARASPARPSA